MPDAEETEKQLAVMLEALDIFQERDDHHQSLWKQSAEFELGLHITSKYKRFMVDPATHIDDGLDLINYIVFQIRRARGTV